MGKHTVLTQEIRARIDDLAATMKKPSAAKIARKLGLKKDGTVYWYMLTRGLIAKKPPSYQNKPYQRHGRTIYPYAPEHDAVINDMRVSNSSFTAIATELVSRFGIPRTPHSVQVRAAFLAAVDDEAAAA